MKGDPSRPPLESVDKEDGGSRIHIPHSEAKRFSKTNAGAVQDQNQRPVQCGSEGWPFQIGAKFQKMKNVLFRERTRKKGGLGRQVRPDRFSYSSRLGRSAQVSVKLPEYCGVGGHANWFSTGFARQPGD